MVDTFYWWVNIILKRRTYWWHNLVNQNILFRSIFSLLTKKKKTVLYLNVFTNKVLIFVCSRCCHLETISSQSTNYSHLESASGPYCTTHHSRRSGIGWYCCSSCIQRYSPPTSPPSSCRNQITTVGRTKSTVTIDPIVIIDFIGEMYGNNDRSILTSFRFNRPSVRLWTSHFT